MLHHGKELGAGWTAAPWRVAVQLSTKTGVELGVGDVVAGVCGMLY